RGTEKIHLTLKEFELLVLFFRNPNRVFTRQELLDKVWGEQFLGETRTVDVHIGTLRTKLGEDGYLIATVRGVGYRLEERHD
ncbi:TPA: winged helix-turn-helix domain-containing protein, partial [Streptococcus agalactiae]